MGKRNLGLSFVFLIVLFRGISIPAQTLDGYWLADSGNLLFDIKGVTVRTFEITSISCLPA